MPLSLSHQKKEAGACEAPVSFFDGFTTALALPAQPA
jgi:hypothetical protein